jgi:hypothetical protein
MSLGIKEFSSSLISNDTRSLKEKGEQSQKLESKNEKMKNTKDNRRKHNYAYEYKYSNRRNKKNECCHENKNTFNPQWSNKNLF